MPFDGMPQDDSCSPGHAGRLLASGNLATYDIRTDENRVVHVVDGAIQPLERPGKS